MRATLTLAALTLTAIAAAGSGLALYDVIAGQLVLVESSAQSALAYADGTVATYQALAHDMPEDLGDKVAVVVHVASGAGSNLGDQTMQAALLATQIASAAHGSTWELVRMEFHALHIGYEQVGDCVFGLDLEAQACTSVDWLVAA